MKKILLALAVLAAAASFASAGVGVNWSVTYGAYDHNAPNIVDDPSDYQLLDNYGVTWQLIYAGANNVADDPDASLGGAGIADDYVTGDDVVWASRIIAQGGGAAGDGSTWSDWMLNIAGSTVYEDLGWNTAGYVFQRVFEGTPAALSWYFESGLEALATGYTGSPQIPQLFELGSGSAGFQPDQQVPAVPEPATMSLLGLGALVMAIRRRRS